MQLYHACNVSDVSGPGLACRERSVAVAPARGNVPPIRQDRRARGGLRVRLHKGIVHDLYAPSWSGFLVVDKWKGVWYTAGSQRDPSPNTPGCAAGSEEG